ncbi:MAG: amidohydrolase family protein [Planctomycetes bacterium]|nr:amidohydrolase family protein [Planctomycetota bacterium]
MGNARTTFLPERTIDATGAFVLPGFVQGHVHLVQMLLRGRAEDLPLLPWLEGFVWPGEAAHDETTLRASARLGLAELIRGGTTLLCDMGTVHGHEVVCEELLASGLTTITGKAMMDADPERRAPARLRETTRNSIEESLRLAQAFHDEGRGLHYGFAPRFALSCTRELLEEVGRLARRESWHVHTHACENRDEVTAVERATGMTNLAYLDDCGLLGRRTVIAHGVHVDEHDLDRLAHTRTTIAHCPAANLKLASGLAPVARYLAASVPLTLGSDGAPCNNRMDPFRELYLAAALAKVRENAPDALSARQALALLTRDGARALGFGDRKGTLEVGRDADVLVIRPDPLSMCPPADPFTMLVYAGDPGVIDTVIARGCVLKHAGKLTGYDVDEVAARAREAADALASRMV